MKTKCLVVFFVFLCAGFALHAQDDDEIEKGFKKENLFTGGTLNVSFGNQFTALGISPFFGYSVNRFVDVAASLGVNYISQRDITGYNVNDKLRQTIYGPGAFIRLFPVNFLFAQAQYEFNLIKYKYIPPPGSGQPTEKYNYDAHSFLVGPGFASGRNKENKSYYYITVMWDLGNALYSPYKERTNNGVRAVPIYRAGYNIALFQGNRNR